MLNLIRNIFFYLLLATPVAGQAQENSNLSDAEREEIERVIHNYILENPEIIPQAIQVLQARERQQVSVRQQDGARKYRAELLNDGISPVQGNPEGEVTVVEFFDFRCVFCRRMHPQVLRILAENKNVRYVYKQFPVRDQPGSPPVSMIAAKAALAADRQGLYAPFHDAMMTETSPLTEDKIFELAAKVGLNQGQLASDMKDDAIQRSIYKNLEIADAIGIDGTPTYIIGDQVIVGARTEAVIAAIEAEARRVANASD